MKGRSVLDVVVRDGAVLLELFPFEDQTLLVRSAIDLLLHVQDGVRWLDIKSDGLAGESFNKDLHGVLC